jgi:hypothetical protein
LGRPGERTAYYVIDDEAWERSIRRRADAIAASVEITGDAVELLDRSGQRGARVRAAHESFQWFSGLLDEALSTLRARRSNR